MIGSPRSHGVVGRTRSYGPADALKLRAHFPPYSLKCRLPPPGQRLGMILQHRQLLASPAEFRRDVLALMAANNQDPSEGPERPYEHHTDTDLQRWVDRSSSPQHRRQQREHGAVDRGRSQGHADDEAQRSLRDAVVVQPRPADHCPCREGCANSEIADCRGEMLARGRRDDDVGDPCHAWQRPQPVEEQNGIARADAPTPTSQGHPVLPHRGQTTDGVGNLDSEPLASDAPFGTGTTARSHKR